MTKRVLVIDDDEAILEAVKMALEMEDYEVETLSRGDNAVDAIKQFSPKLILLDYLLSGEDGREVASRIRSNKECRDVPIIMFSAHPNAENYVRGYGVNGFLPKPFDLDVLIDMVDKYTRA